VTLLRIEPATFWLAVQYLNQLCYHILLMTVGIILNNTLCNQYKIISRKKYLEANTEELWLLLGLGESRFCGMNCPAMAENVPLIK
jgi:hypothetical protein